MTNEIYNLLVTLPGSAMLLRFQQMQYRSIKAVVEELGDKALTKGQLLLYYPLEDNMASVHFLEGLDQIRKNYLVEQITVEGRASTFDFIRRMGYPFLVPLAGRTAVPGCSSVVALELPDEVSD